MTYNVFGGTLNLAQLNSAKLCTPRLSYNESIIYNFSARRPAS